MGSGRPCEDKAWALPPAGVQGQVTHWTLRPCHLAWVPGRGLAIQGFDLGPRVLEPAEVLARALAAVVDEAADVGLTEVEVGGADTGGVDEHRAMPVLILQVRLVGH